MATRRRWRVLALSTLFTLTCLIYLRNKWNYGYTSYAENSPPTVKVSVQRKLESHPVSSHIPLPTGTPKTIPVVQATKPAEDSKQKKERLGRRDAVKASFLHSWTGYKKHAWLRDEVTPITGKYRDTFGGWAATLVDSLDTLWIMGLKKDFELAVKAAESIDFTTTAQNLINVFETTIRYLGGFLAAYDISGGKYPTLLKKAVEVGELLMKSFDTPNRMPVTRWDWQGYARGKPQKALKRVLVSEIGSLSLEFTRLSQLTGDPKYYDAVQRISNEFEKSQSNTMLPGMWPVGLNAEKPSFDDDNFFTLGGMSDSVYEYFPKQYLLLGGLLEQPKTLYEKFIVVAKKYMFFRIYNPKDELLTVSGDIRIKGTKSAPVISMSPRGQHLTCFAGGMLALAAKIFSRPDELPLAEELTAACVWAYNTSAHGIAPEIFNVIPCPRDQDCKWTEKIWQDAVASVYGENEGKSEYEVSAFAKKKISDLMLTPGLTGVDERQYILRPEAIESVFIMYRVTGDQKWAEAAWRMFQAIENVARTDIAHAAIDDVTLPGNVTQSDSMESFWLAETLKYFYLCFEEWDVVSLDKFVLNTEAHPFQRPK